MDKGFLLFRKYDLIGSMNQASNPFTTPDEDFLYLKDISQDEFGAIQKDGGYTSYGTMQSGTGGTQVFNYVKNDGTNKLLAIAGTGLQGATGTTWSDIETNYFISGEAASGVNFLDRFYLATSSVNLTYTDGSTLQNSAAVPADNYVSLGSSTTRFDITNPAGTTWRYTYDGTGTDPLLSTYITVGDIIDIQAQNFAANNKESGTVTAVSGTGTGSYFEITSAAGTVESDKTIGTGYINSYGTIRGKYLAVMEQIMYLGGITHTHNRNEVVYTKVGTHQFFDRNATVVLDGTTYNQGYKITPNKIRVDGEVTGLAVFRGLLYIFTSTSMWYHNPSNLETKLLYNHGTTSHNSIKELWGNLVWADRAGVHMFNGEGLPTNIIAKLQNRHSNSVWNIIDGANWSALNAGVKDDKYYLSVGDLTATIPGDSEDLTGVVLVFDYAKSTWSILSNHPKGTWTTFIDSNGDEQMMFSNPSSRVVYKRDYSYSHNGTAINSVVRTQYFNMGSPEMNKTFYKLYLMVRPQNQSTKYITVKAAYNGSNSYSTIVDSSTSNKISLAGATTQSHVIKRMDNIGPNVGETISYEFSNSDDGINFGILGFSQLYKDNGLNVIPS